MISGHVGHSPSQRNAPRLQPQSESQLFSGSGLTKGDPETIAIANDEFTSSVKRVVQILNNFGFAIKSVSQHIDIVNVRIKIEFTSA